MNCACRGASNEADAVFCEECSSRMACYAIDPASGTLTKLKEYAVGRNPNWVEIVDLP